MAKGHDWGALGEVRRPVHAHLTRRVAGVGLMLTVLGSIALVAYDHRRADLGTAWTALPDGRVASIDSSGHAGPQSVVVVGHNSAEVRPLPPVLRHSTSISPARRPGGFASSPNGWVVMVLGALGHDTEGGEITQTSPSGSLVASMPVLHRRNAQIIGVTDQGLAVFRLGMTVNLLGPQGEAVPMLDLGDLGVHRDLSNLADVSLAADGRLAVLVGDGTASGAYRLFERYAGGAAKSVVRIARDDLFDAPTSARDRPHDRPVVAFAGQDVAVAGQSGLVRLHDGRVQRRVTFSSGDRAHLAPSTLVAMTGGRWAIGRDPLVVLNASGDLHHPGFGPCPPVPELRSTCPAVIAGHRLPRPDDILPALAAVLVAVGLLALAWAGRMGRTEALRLRLFATLCGVAWVTVWLATSLVWGELHGSAPLLLLGAAMAATLAPAFPRIDRPVVHEPAEAMNTSFEPWVTDRINGRSTAARGAKRLEVVPLPSRP